MTKCRVQLRCGLLALVRRCEPETPVPPVGPFVWLAYGELREVEAVPNGGTKLGAAQPVADMWRDDGRWREDGTEHPLDIVRGLAE